MRQRVTVNPLRLFQRRRVHERQAHDLTHGPERRGLVARRAAVRLKHRGGDRAALRLGDVERSSGMTVDIPAAALHEQRDAVAATTALQFALRIARPVAADEQIVPAQCHRVRRVAEQARDGIPLQIVNVQRVHIGRGQPALVDPEDDLRTPRLAPVYSDAHGLARRARLSGLRG